MRETVAVSLLGLLSTAAYAVVASRFAGWTRETYSEALALALGVELLAAFAIAFGLYLLAVAVVLRAPSSRSLLVTIFAFAVFFRLVALSNPPIISDDMYRYVWDGRVQAAGLSPYAYPPAADELRHLRDDVVWSNINRKESPTVYPAGAQLAFSLLWRIAPDDVRFVQVAMSASGLLAGGLLALLLQRLGRSPALALVLIWSPLVTLETTHSAHVDALVLPLVVGAWLGRLSGRDGLVGVLLGLAASVKLYPAFLLAALWRPRDERGRLAPAWRMPVAFGVAFGLTYVPYLRDGAVPIGFLPQYFGEWQNASVARVAWAITRSLDLSAVPPALPTLAAAVAVLGVAFAVRPARDPAQAVRRSVWPIGAYLLLSQSLWPWYAMWLVPLLAAFLWPGRGGLRFDAWTGWLLFTGLVILGYLPDDDWLHVVEYGVLAIFLILPKNLDVLARSGILRTTE